MPDPKQPPSPHAPEEAVHTDATGAIHQHGVPVHATDEEPASLPTSERHQSETALHPQGGNRDGSKHSHNPTE